ncbi:MAG TPA: DUF4012 domain-containing protein [Patescibacteria group bacterium]|nr:DUF4012 domain-containing protein [Patescibacteria group bacterium]
MPTLIIESDTREKPILLIAGSNPLIPSLIEESQKDFKIALVSEENLGESYQGEDLYHIRKDSAHLVKSLEEKIDYAVIFLDQGEDKNYIVNILDKLESDGSKTAVIINTQKVDTFSDIILTYKRVSNFHFLFLGDVYSESKNLSQGFDVAGLIGNSLTNHTVVMTGNDLLAIFPIYYKDAIEGIFNVILGPKKTQKYFYLFYSHPQTLISAIHILKRVEPDLEIQFKDSEAEDSKALSHDEIGALIKTKTLTDPIYLDKYFEGFEKSIDKFVNYTPSQQTQEVKKEKPRSEPKIVSNYSRPKNPKQSGLFIKSLFIAGLLYLLIVVTFSFLAALHLKNAIGSFKQNDYKQASQSIKDANFFIGTISPSIEILGYGAKFFGITTVNMLFNNFSSASTFLDIAAQDIETLERIPQGIDRRTLDNLVSDAYYLYFESQNLKQNSPSNSLNSILSSDLTKAISLARVADKVLGFDGEKNYLILFQNNGELRPTGGFIGSVGELKLANGKIESFEIKDVYDLDGQLKSHIDPPYPVRRNLQTNLYLRDSNFYPDFQETASTAALLYNLETNKKVDGVIAVDYDAVRRIIKEVGPIKLASYNKTIDDKNAFEFLQSTIDDNFFPGSTEKKDVLNALYNQLLLKIEGNSNNAAKVARLIPKLMDDKDILFSFNQNSVQSIFSSEGYGGEYTDRRTIGNDTLNDFLAVNEANIGVNKANITITRSATYKPSFTSKGLGSELIYTIDNSDTKALDYKAYISFAVPTGSRLNSVTIDGKAQKIVAAVTDPKVYGARNFKIPDGLEVDNSVRYNKDFFGFVINVSKGSKQVIDLTYFNGATVPNQDILNYSLFVIKQPGVAPYPFEMALNYGTNYSPQEVKNATLRNGQVIIDKEMDTDKFFEAKLIKN